MHSFRANANVLVLQEEEEEEVAAGGARVIPEDMLQTDTRVGLTSDEVLQRRRKYGLNQMKEEKENLILKFLGFFVGPIQFVMEVRGNPRSVSFRRSKASKRNISPLPARSFMLTHDPFTRPLLSVRYPSLPSDSTSDVVPHPP